MNLLAALVIFILFWWALLATIFSYQLHKQNEDYARRLGKRANVEEVKPDQLSRIRNSVPQLLSIKSLKINFSRLRLIKVWRLLPLKITLK